jgi:RNA polymerase sigma factor (sigma-70 family)
MRNFLQYPKQRYIFVHRSFPLIRARAPGDPKRYGGEVRCGLLPAESMMNTTSASLLGQLHVGDEAAWQSFVDLYTPLIRGWLQRYSVPVHEADDLTQEVLAVVLRRMPDFQHNQRMGAFRAWLRTITVNCMRDFWKSNRIRPAAVGGSDFGNYLDQLSDSSHPLSQAWDREHDEHVTRRLLEMVKEQFEPSTWKAFEHSALEGKPVSEVADEMGMTPNAVSTAKSRVLARLRELAIGLLDE